MRNRKKVSGVVRCLVPGLSDAVRLRILARTGLSDKALIKTDLKEAVENTKAHCSVETLCIMMAAGLSVREAMGEV